MLKELLEPLVMFRVNRGAVVIQWSRRSDIQRVRSERLL